MEKKTYESPSVEVVEVETEGLMIVNSTKGELKWGGGGNGLNRVRYQRHDDWSNGWEE